MANYYPNGANPKTSENHLHDNLIELKKIKFTEIKHDDDQYLCYRCLIELKKINDDHLHIKYINSGKPPRINKKIIPKPSMFGDIGCLFIISAVAVIIRYKYFAKNKN